jgi:branched-chain amino acid transport system ATP-binding protein
VSCLKTPCGASNLSYGQQNAAQALAISDYAYVLELGLNRFEGSGEAIRTDDRIRRLYLGR